ncbi:MAG: TIGR01777 family oxidoreductase [Spirochaetia bacterium]|nr:TIGR01777 family oxidoreductase [Spirochaetia bacterium]
MNILITGATGYLGYELAKKLTALKHSLTYISRNKEKAKNKLNLKGSYFSWNYKTEDFPLEALKNIEAVFHLMGENIGSGRWSKKRKDEIYNSRVLSTQKLVSALPKSVKHFFCASAIGYYPDSLEKKYTEKFILESPHSFLEKTAYNWEKESQKAGTPTRRVVNIRTGIILGKEGILKKLIPVFKLGLGGALGSGKAFMSFIHVDDWTDAAEFCLHNKKIKGPVNFVLPLPVTNNEFSKLLGNTLSRPSFIKTPAFALKIILGEASQLALGSQYVIPDILIKNQYNYKFDSLKKALQSIIK